MIKKTITYTDYNNVERTEDFYFNLNKAELIELEMSTPGGIQNYLESIRNNSDTKALLNMFKTIILKSYGVKSADGRGFEKSEALSEAFSHTEAYSELFMQLLSDEVAAASFMNGVIPQSLANEIAKHPELMAQVNPK